MLINNLPKLFPVAFGSGQLAPILTTVTVRTTEAAASQSCSSCKGTQADLISGRAACRPVPPVPSHPRRISQPHRIHVRPPFLSHDCLRRAEVPLRLRTSNQAVGQGLAITRSLAPSFGPDRTDGVRHTSARALVPPGRALVTASAIEIESDDCAIRASFHNRLSSYHRLLLGAAIIDRISQEKGKKHSKWRLGRKRRRLPRMSRSTSPFKAFPCLAAVRSCHDPSMRSIHHTSKLT